jgi:hypothetical protein
MPKFLMQATFSQDAAKRLVKDGGTKRAGAVQALLKQQEARLEKMYFRPQNDGPDVFAIVEMAGRRSRRARGHRSGRQDCGYQLNRQADLYAGRAG